MFEFVDVDRASFNPTDLLRPKTQKSELYKLALTGLQNLHKESSCHRIAASLYTTNCQLLEDFEVSRDRSVSVEAGSRLRDYIHSFAASLAICDLEAAHAIIPDTCEDFRESTLLRVAGSKSVKGLHVSHDQIGQCMNGLHSDQNSWTSFNSNKDTAGLFCQVARIDIEKDDFISTMQMILGILQEMDLSADQRKKDLLEEELALKIHFQRVHDEVNGMTSGISEVWASVSKESNEVSKSIMDLLKNTSGDARAIDLALKRLLKSMMEGNAEHALAQQAAMKATTDLAAGAQNANVAVIDFRQLMIEVATNVSAMGAAMVNIEQRHAEAMSEQLTKTQTLIKGVREELHDVKNIISEVKDNAEKSAKWVSSFALDVFSGTGPGGISWLLLVCSPLMTVILGGYGIPASYSRNFGLALLGLVIAKVLTALTNEEWHVDFIRSSSLPQLAREKLSSTIITFPSVVEEAMFSTAESTN